MVQQYGILWGRVETTLADNNKEINPMYKWGYLLVHVAQDAEKHKQKNQLYLIIPGLTAEGVIYGAIELTTNMRKYKQTHNVDYLRNMRPMCRGSLIDVLQHILLLDGQKSECNFIVVNGKELKMKRELMGIAMPTTYKLAEVKAVLSGKGQFREIFWGRHGSDYYTAVLNDVCEVEIEVYGVSALLTNYNGKYANIVGVDGRPEFKDAIARKHCMGEPVYPADLKISKLTEAGVRVRGSEVEDVNVEDIVGKVKSTAEMAETVGQSSTVGSKPEVKQRAVNSETKQNNEIENEKGTDEDLDKCFDKMVDGSRELKEEKVEEGTEVAEEIENEVQFLHPLKQDEDRGYYACLPYAQNEEKGNWEYRRDYGCFGRYASAIRWLDTFGEFYARPETRVKYRKSFDSSLFKLIDVATKSGTTLPKSLYSNYSLYFSICSNYFKMVESVPIWDLATTGVIKSSNYDVDKIVLLQAVLRRYKQLYTDDTQKTSHRGTYKASYYYALINYDTGIEDVIEYIEENCPNVVRCIKKFGSLNLNTAFVQADFDALMYIHEKSAAEFGKAVTALTEMGNANDGVITGIIDNIRVFQGAAPVEQALTVLCLRYNRNRAEIRELQGYYLYLNEEEGTYLDKGYLIYNACPLFLYNYKDYVARNFKDGEPITLCYPLKDNSSVAYTMFTAAPDGRVRYTPFELVDYVGQTYNLKNNTLSEISDYVRLYVLELKVMLLDELTERDEVLKRGLYVSYMRYIAKYTTKLEMELEKAFKQLAVKFCYGVMHSMGYTVQECTEIRKGFKQISQRTGINIMFALCAYMYKYYYGDRAVYWYNEDNDVNVQEYVKQFEEYKGIVNNDVFSDFLKVFVYLYTTRV